MEANVRKHISVPIFEMGPGGVVRPNPIFHRPLDHLHSRCIEYPFSASKLGTNDSRVLDIGTAKADRAWVDWLEQLSGEIHGTDYDLPDFLFKKVRFVSSDVRSLPYRENYFDVVFAVSVIEHIGLSDPQVFRDRKPLREEEGDLTAIKEISRVLKPGGKLVMTVPFGGKAGLILNKQARSYDSATIKKFETGFSLRELEVFEYGPERAGKRSPAEWLKLKITAIIGMVLRRVTGLNFHELGMFTWNRVSPENCRARNAWHVDAVVCGVWEKTPAGTGI